jgi:hypothetical protein
MVAHHVVDEPNEARPPEGDGNYSLKELSKLRDMAF